MKTETLHKSDCAVHNEPAYPNGPCDWGAIEKPIVEFETEYQLDQFRTIQGQYFDEYNIHYSGTAMDKNTAQKMLELINQLEKEVRRHAKFVNY